MAKSKPRKQPAQIAKRSGHPAQFNTITPGEVMSHGTLRAAEAVTLGLNELRKFADKHPEEKHLGETILAFKVASLSLLQAYALQTGRPDPVVHPDTLA